MWWNFAGGINGKLNDIKLAINDYSPLVFFVFEANIRTIKINTHFNITGYDLFYTDSELARTSCYVKSNSGYEICRGSGTQSMSVMVNGMLTIGVYRQFKVDRGSSLTEEFDDTIHYLNSKIA